MAGIGPGGLGKEAVDAASSADSNRGIGTAVVSDASRTVTAVVAGGRLLHYHNSERRAAAPRRLSCLPTVLALVFVASGLISVLRS